MGESRGKRAKKAWEMRVGIKELIFAGLGVTGMVMMSFALGTMAGRGDIYRVLSNWGLLGPDSGRVGQIWYQPTPPPQAATPVVALATPAPQQEAPPAEQTPPHHERAIQKTPVPAPVKPIKANIIAPPNPVEQVKKKSTKHELKAKEDQLEKIRREVAGKLKFQNSLDLAATRGASAKKGNDKEQAAAGKAASPSATPQVVLVKYRNLSQARVKLAQMQKQGEKVVLKEGKDNEGQYYALCRAVPAKPAESHQAAHPQAKKTKFETKSAKSPGQREASTRR
jgi:hypothetical protein